MALFKDVYNREFYEKLASAFLKLAPRFDNRSFIQDVLSGGFEQMEYKERMRHTSLMLNKNLPYSFADTAFILVRLSQILLTEQVNGNPAYMFLPDYIELYGIDDFDTSVNSFEQITKFVSCEFAVRPFILKYGDRMINRMEEWSQNENEFIRRLASEGCRPRLPWAMSLPFLKEDPSPILLILENLKKDPSETVRRSVANNLNDIAKDNPDTVIRIAHSWHGKCRETDAVVKHACRTLLKSGNAEILKLYGLDYNQVKTGNLKIEQKTVAIGESLSFSFEVENLLPEKQTVRLEYGLYYQKANGTLSRKVFKISERVMNPSEKITVTRSHSFKVITTRKFHVGEHAVSVIINGNEFDKESFVLTEK